MHWPARPRSHRRTLPRCAAPWSLRTWPLENRASPLNPTRRSGWRGIHRTRTGLRHHHAPHRNRRNIGWRSRSRLCLDRRSRGCGLCSRSSRRRGLGLCGNRNGSRHRRSRSCGHSASRNTLRRSRRRCWRSHYHWRPCHHRSNRRLACNRRRRSNNRSRRPRLGNNSSRRRRCRCHRTRRLCSRWRCRRSCGRARRAGRCCAGRRRCSRSWRTGTCRCDDRSACRSGRYHRRWPCRLALGHRLLLFPFQDRLQRVAGLRNMGEVERRLRLATAGPSRLCAAAPILQIVAHAFGLVGLNRARVRLWFSHADCRQSVQNGPALDFKFPREIIDSNFAHPSLFV